MSGNDRCSFGSPRDEALILLLDQLDRVAVRIGDPR